MSEVEAKASDPAWFHMFPVFLRIRDTVVGTPGHRAALLRSLIKEFSNDMTTQECIAKKYG